ncbi:MAG: adenosylcobinamide-GDP ribazoletransferase [Lentisphaerae bacterium]|nr:MAG: adenosylcobinamide-GDP ribazoletransferase [Lentisphaerota bacterium]
MSWLRGFGHAVGFLTRIPVPEPWYFQDFRESYRSLKWFVPVGIILAGVLCAVQVLLLPFCPRTILAWIIAGLWIALSGGLHLDGLADSADAIFSGKDREKMLEIMKDSRIGSMGVIALFLLLSGKLMALNYLELYRPDFIMPIVASAVVYGRCALLWSIWRLPYARKSGIGESFWRCSAPCALLSFLASLAWGILLFWPAWGKAMILGGLLTGCWSLLNRFFYTRLGGGTGDTLGATCELTELAALLLGSCMVH